MRPSPIAVVIPAYNAEAFVGAAICSVQAQTMPVADIVVVDDGSTDATARVAGDHGARVLRQPHLGISAARNAGVRATAEPWIAFLDADDLWYPEKIERQWAAIELYPATGLVTCDMDWFEGEPHVPAEQQQDERVSYFATAPAAFLASDMSWATPAVIARRDALLSVGLWDESLRGNEDFDCFLRVLRDWPLVVIHRPLGSVRVHEGSDSKDYLKVYLCYIEVLERMSTFPERYPREAARAYEPSLRDKLYKTGLMLLRQGRKRESRALFARRFRLRRSPRVIWYWSLSWVVPKGWLKRLR